MYLGKRCGVDDRSAGRLNVIRSSGSTSSGVQKRDLRAALFSTGGRSSARLWNHLGPRTKTGLSTGDPPFHACIGLTSGDSDRLVTDFLSGVHKSFRFLGVWSRILNRRRPSFSKPSAGETVLGVTDMKVPRTGVTFRNFGGRQIFSIGRHRR
jgi:hypothetical protein